MQSGSSVKLETKGERVDPKVKARQLLEAALGVGGGGGGGGGGVGGGLGGGGQRPGRRAGRPHYPCL